MKKAYEYLLLKRNGNSDGLIYDRLVFNNSKDARKEFRKDDILMKCKTESIYYGDNWKGWTVKDKDIVARYEK
jgi:hypothetical protein